MYYSKEELERMRKKGEEQAKELMEREKGSKYKSKADLQINCLHCKNDHFIKSDILLNTRGLTIFDLEWLNQSAITLVCDRCGFIHWFSEEVEKL